LAAGTARLAAGTAARGIAVAWAVAIALACASHAPAKPQLGAVWRDYLALPAERALAIAGDPGRDRWVAASSSGHPNREHAEAEAISRCRTRRGLRRMRAECVLYAVGDEIVWRGQ
jgi:hypothetical protein